MSDAELRRLEREAQSKGPEARVRLARAYERAGRALDAVTTLMRGVDDPTLRREVTRLEGAVPIRSGARVRWTTEVELDVHTLLASRLGIVVGSRDQTVVLDPDTGATKLQVRGGEVYLADEVLLVRTGGGLLGHDLWTGEELFTKNVLGVRDLLRHGGTTLVAGRSRELVVYRFDDVRRAPRLAWRAGSPYERTVAEAVTRDVVVLPDAEGLVVRSAADGAVRGRCHPPAVLLADERGLIVSLSGGTVGEVSPQDGALRWQRRERDEQLFAMRPDVLVLLRGGGTDHPELVVVDRGSGAETAAHPVPLAWSGADCTIVGDVMYLTTDVGVKAFSLDGAPLWTLSAGHSVTRVATAPGRLLLAGGVFSSTITCLEEAEA